MSQYCCDQLLLQQQTEAHRKTLQAALNHMFSDTDEFFAQMGNSGEGILRNMMMYMLQGAVRYPGLIKAMLTDPSTIMITAILLYSVFSNSQMI
jgi:hypothetical protein